MREGSRASVARVAVALCARVNGVMAWPSGEAAAGQQRRRWRAMMAGYRGGAANAAVQRRGAALMAEVPCGRAAQ